MRLRTWLMLGMVLCGTLDADHAQAQTRADSAAVLLRAAEQLRMSGETGAARAVLELIARQYAGTPAAQEVERMMALLRRTPDVERSGRTELLVFGATYGAWLGVAAPLALDVESPEGYGLGLLLGAPLGFYAAKQYADAKMPTEGQSRALTFGGTWGTANGIALVELLDIDDGTRVECPAPGECFEVGSGADAQTYVTAAVAGGLLGIGTGALLARKPITAGTAAAASLGGMWGAWFGFGATFLAGLDDDALLAGPVIGGNASLAAIGLVAPRWQISESRARLISIGGVAGGLAGAGLLLIVQPGGERTPLLLPLIGSATGLALATQWTRQRAVDDGDPNGPDDQPDERTGPLREAPLRLNEGSGGALLNLSGGRWLLNVPEAGLRLQRTGQGRAEPAAYVPLLRARF